MGWAPSTAWVLGSGFWMLVGGGVGAVGSNVLVAHYSVSIDRGHVHLRGDGGLWFALCLSVLGRIFIGLGFGKVAVASKIGLGGALCSRRIATSIGRRCCKYFGAN